MVEVARAVIRSTASASRFFERWCDLPSHPEWAPSMEYFALDGPFGLGATGRSRAVGGAETRFTVTAIGPGWVYADTTQLDGARLTVRHEAVDEGTGTIVTLTGSLEGENVTALSSEIGPGLQRALERDLRSLAAMLEAEEPDGSTVRAPADGESI
ncbi:SRPBCC family protein [Microbacterium yannicii]|uniref:SRPBCC family protein n=1 Tax=Microbacterium yannicii TaxID=671622 RepID=UPI0002D3C780|nr:SRPBCC family protein [Microbacterium yannicii]